MREKILKKRFIQILLLCSLLFNIAHATVIALEDNCHHDSVSEYILDTHVDNDCGDICDMPLERPLTKTTLIHQITYYTPPFKQTNIKPPIT